MANGRNEGDGTVGSRDRAGSPAWWLVAGVLVAAFLARGPLYLSVFPPFEGWDEYQHLAYIAHLDETGTIPVLSDTTRVPLSLRPLVVSMPHSQWGGEQVQEWGALSYADYWNAAAPIAGTRGTPASSPRLYQAQHPPLAYVLAWPVWRALKTSHPLEAIYAIRAMNLLLVAVALVAFAAALTRLLPSFTHRAAVFALVCLHPLFFQNAARVANDALALATGMAGISLLVLADGRTLLSRGLMAAACIAAGIWSKQTGLTLIPALILGLPLIGRAHGVPAGRLLRVTGVVSVALVVLVAPLWVWNLERYGSIVTTQESIELAARGSLVQALAAAVVQLNWTSLIDTLFVPGRPWVGGWSFLRMNETLRDVYEWSWLILLAAAAAGGVAATLRRVRPVDRAAPLRRTNNVATAGSAICAAVVFFVALGMIYHALVGQAVFGRSNTNPWYFMTALPFLFVLVIRGLEAVNRRLAIVAAAALTVLFVVIDLHGTWVLMPQSYASTTDAALQWARLSAIHPAVLSGNLRWLFLATQLGSLGMAVAALVYASRNRVPAGMLTAAGVQRPV
jgi:hypothetical protein